MDRPGHLFIFQADLTRLASDVVVVPCDGAALLRGAWEQFMPEGTIPVRPGWVRFPAHQLKDGHDSLTGRAGTVTELVATYGFTDIGRLVERVVTAVRRGAQRATPGAGRALPLVALPLAGTGAGGLAHRRGAVIERLLPALEKLVIEQSFDVALILFDTRDHAAVQARRDPAAGRRELGALVDEADRLGRLAASGGLSLFVGSGVSIPLGLPSWRDLLLRLDPARTIGPDDDLLAVAEEIISAMNNAQAYQEFMVSQFNRDHHTLGHALLAGLGVRQMITTNYDPCLELALDSIHGREGYTVMTRSLTEGEKPWLLKLHGDIARPDRLVLTSSEYQRLAEEHGPLHGVVESLMMTSHLMFVGFGLRDVDYVKLAKDVAATRNEAEVDGQRPPVGTALSLARNTFNDAHVEGLVELPMAPDDTLPHISARLLEVFLDRVLMQATRTGARSGSYFLDERFSEAFSSSADMSLRRRLLKLAHDASTFGSAGREAVDQLLRDLGHEAEESS